MLLILSASPMSRQCLNFTMTNKSLLNCTNLFQAKILVLNSESTLCTRALLTFFICQGCPSNIAPVLVDDSSLGLGPGSSIPERSERQERVRAPGSLRIEASGRFDYRNLLVRFTEIINGMDLS